MSQQEFTGDEKTAAYHQARKAWIKRGPIRRRRYALGYATKSGRAQPLSQMDLAGGVGVNMLTIQNWEHGAVTPSDAGFKALSIYFKEPVQKIRDEWQAWYQDRPMPPQLHFGAAATDDGEDDESNAEED